MVLMAFPPLFTMSAAIFEASALADTAIALSVINPLCVEAEISSSVPDGLQEIEIRRTKKKNSLNRISA